MKPIVLAMVICDYYYRDVATGKSVLAGTFSSITAPAFPTKHGNCAVYLAMTDVAAHGKCQLLFRKEDGSYPIRLPPWDVKCPPDRRAVIEIGGNIAGLPIPQEGDYEFVVLWDEQEIFSRRFLAAKVPYQQQPTDQPPSLPEPPHPDLD